MEASACLATVPIEVACQIHGFMSPFDLARLTLCSNPTRKNVRQSMQHYKLSFDLQESYRVNDSTILGMLESLKDVAENSQHINLSRCFNISNNGISTLASACSSLRSIQLGGTIGIFRTYFFLRLPPLFLFFEIRIPPAPCVGRSDCGSRTKLRKSRICEHCASTSDFKDDRSFSDTRTNE